jgi:hypothetical protein
LYSKILQGFKSFSYTLRGGENHENRGYQIYQIKSKKPVNYPKICFFITASKMVLDEQPTGFKNDGFLETGQLHKCLSAYI